MRILAASVLCVLAAGILTLIPYDAYGGLGYVPGQLVYELGIGESQTREIPMILDTVGDLEVFATGRGSELLTFEEYIPITETYERFLIDVTVSIPDDYVCERYLEADVFVRQISSSEGLIVISGQIFTPAKITILDAPETPDPALCAEEPVDDTASEPEPSVQPAQPAAPAGDEGSQELVATLIDNTGQAEPTTLDTLRALIEDLRDTIEAQYDVMERMADSITYWQAEVSFLAQDVEDLTERNDVLARENKDLMRENEELKRLLEPDPKTPERGHDTDVSITIQTDQNLYAEGDTITISGNVEDYAELSIKSDVTLIVKNPGGDIVNVRDVIPDATGTYTTTLLAEGNLWKAGGEYTIEANFGPQKITTTFEFAGISGTTAPPTIICSSNQELRDGVCVDPLVCPDGTTKVNRECVPDMDMRDTSITVRIDQTHYTMGDTVTITGTVSKPVPGNPVTITVTNPSNNIVSITQADVGADMAYRATISITDLFAQDGEYTAIVQYGDSGPTTTATFEVKVPVPAPAG